MNTEIIINVAKKVLGRAGLYLKKYAPEILIGAGVTGIVTSTVMACKATTKLNDVIEDHTERLEEHRNEIVVMNKDAEETGIDIKKEDQKGLIKVYTKTALNMVKLYGPSVGLAALSITSILGAHTIQKNRTAAISTAYALVNKAFNEYKDRVEEKYGSEAANDIAYGVKTEKIKETVTDPETGKNKKIEKVISEATAHGAYTICYEPGCAGWDDNPEFSKMYLCGVQDQLNLRLRTKGHVFYNEVLDMLGLPSTSWGQVVGWLYNPDDKTKKNVIDFHIFDLSDKTKRDFVNGYEPCIWLDLDPDGVIIDMLGNSVPRADRRFA